MNAVLLVLALSQPGDVHRLSVEFDPIPYASNGFDLAVAYGHPDAPRLRALVSAYVLDMPALTLPAGFHNRQSGTTLMLATHAADGARGFFVGALVSLTSNVYTHDDAGDASDANTTLVLCPVAGYRWFPFGHGLFVLPWLRVGYSIPVIGDTAIKVGTRTFDAPSVEFLATFHVGYEFEL